MNQKHNLTIDDIARELGVSKTTVSRAISGKGRIGPATRERVLAYIQKYNYRPSAAAKGLAESKTYNLALVLPREFIKLDLPFIRQSMSAICEEAHLRDYNILLCLTSDGNPDALVRTLDNRKVDGVILSRTVEGDILLDHLIQRRIPFATMGSLPAVLHGQAAVEVDNDHLGGARALTEVFFSSGVRNAALLGGDMAHMVNQRRLEGFQQAAQAHPEVHCTIHTGLNRHEDCRLVLQQLLEKGVRRFLAMDDDICAVIAACAGEAGLRIPEDVQLASFYDNEPLKNHHPPITALQFDEEALGRTACRELLRCLAGEEYAPVVLLNYQIISRGSEV